MELGSRTRLALRILLPYGKGWEGLDPVGPSEQPEIASPQLCPRRSIVLTMRPGELLTRRSLVGVSG